MVYIALCTQQPFKLWFAVVNSLFQSPSVSLSKHMAQAYTAPRPCYCCANNSLSCSEAESRQTKLQAI